MPIHCPQCGKQHDVVQFEGNRRVQCSCGFFLDVMLLETVDDFVRYFENEDERKKAQEIQKDAATICRMILNKHCQKVDIDIAKEKLEEKVLRLFPDKMVVYQMVYESRFNRLWEQFRVKNQGPD